jgi:hypothetical protein
MSTKIVVISREFDGNIIQQRELDGYVNLTAMCKACGKLFADYHRLNNTQAFLQALSSDMGIHISELIQIVKGGFSELQGTWGHPKVAIHLAQWLSPTFSVQVTNWVFEWLTTGQKPTVSLPYHLRRYLANQPHIPYNFFSIINELTIRLIAPLELQGYVLPDNMLPDISEGLIFNRWLRKQGLNPKEILTYIHAYEDGRRVKVKMYPIELWPDFIKHFHEEWLPKHAQGYFQKRDPEALPFLPKLLEARMTKSLTDLLKAHNAPYSAQKMNKILLEMGIIEEKTRPSSKGGEKQYKAFTEEGRIYGKNVVKPQKPEETQPRFYEDTFEQLLIMIRNYLDR